MRIAVAREVAAQVMWLQSAEGNTDCVVTMIEKAYVKIPDK